MAGLVHKNHEAAAYRLPSELLIQVAENFSFSDLVFATHVSRLWRSTLLIFPTLWDRLDMVCFGEKALTFIPYLLHRSKARPLELSLDVYIIRDPNYSVAVDAFYLALAPHMHRLRRLSWRCLNHRIVYPLFDLIGTGAPMLQSLDLDIGLKSYPMGKAPREGAFTRTPQLSCVRWVGFPIPAALDGLSHVAHIRISQNSLPRNPAVFDLFPRARSVRVDEFSFIERLGTVPTAHPVERLELAVDSILTLPLFSTPISWSELNERRCTKVPILVLRKYSIALLFEACHERIWHAKSLTIKYDDVVDAVLRQGARECRMIGLRPRSPTDWLSAERLMHEYACLRTVEHLEITLPVTRRRPLVPELRMHALKTLVILCARSMTAGGEFTETELPKSVLDPEVLSHCGTLRAPNLKTLVLKYYPWRADWQDPEYDGLIDTAALAKFIVGHIQIEGGGGLLPELRVDSPRVRLAEDVEGMAALKAVVGTIILGL